MITPPRLASLADPPPAGEGGLALHGVSAGYAGADVIHGVDLTVQAGEIVTLIGANGAGKSTLVKAISGLVPTRAGTIVFTGQRIERLTTAARMRVGIVHVPEGRQIFAGLTVGENLRLGAYLDRGATDIGARLEPVLTRFPALRDRLDALAGNLSGGQQQMLAIGRGLMAAPTLLILDEPSLGLAPRLVDQMFDLVRGLRAQGLAILLSEQNAQMSLAIADRGYVIENGRVVLGGTGAELLQSREVAERYLGIGAAQSRAAVKGGELAQRLQALLRA
jgi:branched-chain amino acid transport system ATP-binding protein